MTMRQNAVRPARVCVAWLRSATANKVIVYAALFGEGREPAEPRLMARGDKVDGENTLQTIAQIAVSLAGVAGIAGALAGAKLRPSQPMIWLSFWVLISSSFGVLFSALFPFLPHHLGARDDVAWAVSSGLMAVVTLCNLGFFLPAIARAKRAGSLVAIPAFEIPLNVCPALVVGSQLLNALGVGLGRSAGGFLIGLYFLLLIAVLNFVQLLYVLDDTAESLPDE